MVVHQDPVLCKSHRGYLNIFSTIMQPNSWPFRSLLKRRRRPWSCPDIVQAAIISYYYPVTWIYPALILAGGLTTLITKRKEVRQLSSHTRLCEALNTACGERRGAVKQAGFKFGECTTLVRWCGLPKS